MQSAAVTRETFHGTLMRWAHSRKVQTILQILFLLGMGVATAMVKKIQPSLGIPGSSAPLWLGTMVAGRALIRRDGGGALIGATVAVAGIPIGLNNGFIHNLGLYGLTGLALDLVTRIPKLSIRNPFGAIVCGASAHMVKFGFITAAAYTSVVTKHFLVVGLAQSAGLHLVFGAAAGLIGWGAYTLTRIRRK